MSLSSQPRNSVANNVMYGSSVKEQEDDIVTFSPLQLNYLMKMFPQIVFNANHNEANMRHYFGAQSVIQAVREKTRGLNNAL